MSRKHSQRASFAMHGLCALTYIIVTLALFALLGAFDLDDPDNAVTLRERNGAFALPIFSAYLWLANQYLQTRTLSSLRRFIQRNRMDIDPDLVAMRIRKRTKIHAGVAVLTGSIISYVYLYSEGLLASGLDYLSWLLNALAVVFWTLGTFLALQIIYITRFINENFLSEQNIDLFGIRKMLPISDLVITNTVISSLCLALIPLFWLGREVPTVDKFIVSAVFLMMCCFLFWPVLRVQKSISGKKSLAIERINESVKRLFEVNDGTNRRLTDDPGRLRQLGALISAKQEIAHASEWPIDLPQSLKGLFFSLAIPLSWVAASLIETFIARLNML